MKAIMACDPKGGIGLNGQLPWPKIPVDLKRFRMLTDKGVVVMGRKTWEANDMPKPLPNRTNMIVSTRKLKLLPGVLQVKDIKWFEDYQDFWLIGGAGLFTSMMYQINEIHLTRVTTNYDCDTHIDLSQLYNNFNVKQLTYLDDHTYEILIRKS